MAIYYLGTMGFSYRDWSGAFYPRDYAPRQYLGYYSRIFNAIEIDATFYGAPKPPVVARWAAVTPEEFKICVKMPRTVTHELGLLGVGAEDLTREFLEVISGLGDKLGVILLQFPPGFEQAQAPRLARYLGTLPHGFRFAVEFRHTSWNIPATAHMLKAHNIGWAATEYRDLPQRIQLTSDFLYLRWIGWHGRYARHDREQADLTGNLTAWWERLQDIQDEIACVYGFMNNDYAGHAPATLDRFKAIAGLPRQPLGPPKQPKLL
jgi:uncharacterized protein YecE (DUF72 family)